MNCLYCQHPCYADGEWAVCDLCEANYELNDELSFHIRFDRDIGNWTYALNLYPESKRTVLVGFNSKHSLNWGDPLTHKEYLNIELDSCMKGVTSSNCVNKIKTILLFL